MTQAEAYDFRKPAGRTGETEQRLGGWLRSACALGQTRWVRRLPFRVELTPLPLRADVAAEQLPKLPEPAVGYRVAVQDGIVTLLAVPRQLALALVAGMLGETGADLPPDQELTVVEESLLEHFLQENFLGPLEESWPGTEAVSLKVRQKEANPRFARLFVPDELVIQARFRLKAPFGEQDFVWLLPQKGLAGLLTLPPGAAPPVASRRPQVEAIVQDLPVEVSVELGTVDLPLGQLAALRPGDVVILKQRVGEPLRAAVAGAEMFRVWPGRVGSRQAFQVDAVLE